MMMMTGATVVTTIATEASISKSANP
ncbi:hypothetical protein GGD50_000942 [Rhizobium paranaense]|uniref:Uncharacterized protein n=1 Tax=Rhizobium paranaense TaxID=1650438 RepID=A0A7W8XN07_9HYPH|nr:hypothetical protein [Rhizobium paranaense]